MKKTELLDSASMKLAEVVLLLTAAGEKRLAHDARELAEAVEFRAIPFENKISQTRTSQ